MTRWTTAALVAFAGAAFGQAGGPLDLERITLYRSGVGSFEWRGVIEGDKDLSLRFDRDRINDILKSMVLLDAGGGRIEAVGYDSKEPLERRLAGFAIDVGGGSLQEILAELRGSPVRLSEPGRTTEGIVVGLGYREELRESSPASRVEYVNVLTDGGIRPIELGNIGQMTVLDERLAGELESALAALAESSNAATATVDLRFRGAGVRPVVVGYVHESPVWKTSYRLVLPDAGRAAGSAGGGGRATLQGWAIVENTTDEDWDDVTLTLVSGRPVGFTMNLYEPLFLDRPEVPVPVEGAAAPKVYERGEESELARTVDPAASRRMNREALSAPALGVAADGASWADYSPAAQATARERGELFVYELDEPVTIERRRSAMIPLLSSAVSSRRVSIYNENDLAAHPMRGVELTNDSGLKLMPGPVTVFDGGAFAGDAQIGSFAAGETRLLAHAVDLDVAAEVDRDNRTELTGVSISGRALRRTYRDVSTTEYAFTNRANADRVVLIEVAKRPGMELLNAGGPSEETPRGYRFELTVPAGETRSKAVAFERVRSDRIGLTDRPLEQLAREVRGQRVSARVIEALERGAALQAQVAETERHAERLRGELRTEQGEQQRLRANLQAVPRDSDLYRRYLEAMDASEDRLSELTRERAEADRAVDRARAAFESYVRDLKIG